MNEPSLPKGCYPNPSGSIRAVVTVGPRQISRTFRGADEAAAWRTAALAATRVGRPIPEPRSAVRAPSDSYAPFADAARRWFVRYQREQHRHNPRSEHVMERMLSLRIVPFFGSMSINGITVERVESFRDSLANEGLALSTQSTYLRVARLILEDEVGRGSIPGNPARHVKALPPKKPLRPKGRTPYIPVTTILAATRLVHPEYRVGMWIQGLCGLRVGELWGLEVSDWDPIQRILTVDKQGGGLYSEWVNSEERVRRQVNRTKTLSGVRVVGVPKPLADLIEQHLARRPGNVGDGGRIMRTRSKGFHYAAYRTAVGDAFAALGVTDSLGARVSTHALRKSCASTLDTLVIQPHVWSYIMGHRGATVAGSAAITETHYNVRSPLVDELVAIADKLTQVLSDAGIETLDVGDTDRPAGGWLTLPEACAELSKSESGVLLYAKTGRLRLARNHVPGERTVTRLVARADVDRILAERMGRVSLDTAASELGLSMSALVELAGRLGIPVRRDRESQDPPWFEAAAAETLYASAKQSAAFYEENVTREAAAQRLGVPIVTVAKLINLGFLTPVELDEGGGSPASGQVWLSRQQVERLADDSAWRSTLRPPARPSEELVTPAEAAILCGLSSQSILKLRRQGIINGKVIGGRVWIDAQSAATYGHRRKNVEGE